jgi:hypothetical protein
LATEGYVRAGRANQLRNAAPAYPFWNKPRDLHVLGTEENSMAQAAWKRPGSPIGKIGPRKRNPIYKRRSREPWSDADLKQLKQLAKGNTPTGVMSIKLQRPPAAIRSKAQREGISLKPTNRSPYNRRKRR